MLVDKERVDLPAHFDRFDPREGIARVAENDSPKPQALAESARRTFRGDGQAEAVTRKVGDDVHESFALPSALNGEEQGCSHREQDDDR